MTPNLLEADILIGLLSPNFLGVNFSSAFHATLTFDIYLFTAFHQKSVPTILSISRSSFTSMGSLIPNLCVVRQYLSLISDINLLGLRTIRNNRHLNAGSSTIRFATAYSATSMGLDYFKSFRSIHLVCPSLHLTSSFQPNSAR